MPGRSVRRGSRFIARTAGDRRVFFGQWLADANIGGPIHAGCPSRCTVVFGSGAIYSNEPRLQRGKGEMGVMRMILELVLYCLLFTAMVRYSVRGGRRTVFLPETGAGKGFRDRSDRLENDAAQTEGLHDTKVIGFLRRLKKEFPGSEVIFDAMTGKAVKYANDYIRKTGNNDARLHFSADSGKTVAEKCGMELVEERPFFGAARKQLKKELKLYTRIAMKVVDESGRRAFLTHLKDGSGRNRQGTV